MLDGLAVSSQLRLIGMPDMPVAAIGAFVSDKQLANFLGLPHCHSSAWPSCGYRALRLHRAQEALFCQLGFRPVIGSVY